MRAVDLGVDVNFAQRLAEDTKFPNGHFDVVTSFLLHHEVTADKSREIFREINRVLRPGGVYFPIDLSSRRPRGKDSVWAKYNRWWNNRWNGEVWYMEYNDLDFDGEMRAAGLEVSNGPPAGASYGGSANVMATKPG
jgi:SAM-dependent methyltransferase